MAAVGGRVLGFWSRYAVEHVYLVGFIRRRLDVHISDIDVMSLLEFVDLGHSTEPRWLRDVVESRSNKEACMTSNDGVHVIFFFTC